MTQQLIKQSQIDLTGGGGFFVPAGALFPYGGTIAPTGFVLCDGATYDSVANTEYALLYSILGTNFGGTGPADFNVPDMRGRTAVGLDQDGSPTGAPFNVFGAAVGDKEVTLTSAQMPAHVHGSSAMSGSSSTDGAHTHTVTGSVASGGSHQHPGSWSSCEGGGGDHEIATWTGTTNWWTGPAGTHTHALTGATALSDGDHSHTITLSGNTDSEGSGDAHSNIQPSLVTQYIISIGA